MSHLKTQLEKAEILIFSITTSKLLLKFQFFAVCYKFYFEPVQNFFCLILKFVTFKNTIRKDRNFDFFYNYLKIAFEIAFFAVCYKFTALHILLWAGSIPQCHQKFQQFFLIILKFVRFKNTMRRDRNWFFL